MSPMSPARSTNKNADEQFAQIAPSSAVRNPSGRSASSIAFPREDDDADMHTADASVLLEDVQASPAKPMTRKLERSHVAAQEPADDSSSKTKVLRSAPLLLRGQVSGETRGGFTLPAFRSSRHTEHAAEADERELARQESFRARSRISTSWLRLSVGLRARPLPCSKLTCRAACA